MQDHHKQPINRRKFVTSLGLLGAVAGFNPLTAVGRSEIKLSDGTLLMKCKPYLQAAQPTNITIRWITHVNCYSWVEYGESRTDLRNKAHRVTEGLVQANNTVHDITLQNLLPGKTYYYRCVSKRIDKFVGGKVFYAETFEDSIYQFTTPKETKHLESIEFLIFNDIHDRPESFAKLMEYQGKGEKDFIFLNGDMFNNLKDENQIIDHLIAPLSELFATRTPYMFSRGNHEARGSFARQLGGYFDGKEHKFYYSFQHGPMYAIVLDSGEDKEDEHPEYGGITDFDIYRLQQKAWLEQEVQRKEFLKAKYKVVLVHIPLYHTPNEDAHGAKHSRECWGDILNKAKIDLMVSGHTHRYKIHQPIAGKHNYPIVIGGGPQDGFRTIINVKADSKALKLTMTDDKGVIVGSLQI